MVTPAELAFEHNLAQLSKLVRFDDELLVFVLTPLRRHKERLVQAKVHERLHPNGVIQTLENIKSADSLRGLYQALHNQWLVLLASYFSSAVKQLFVDSVADAIRRGHRKAVLEESVKVTIEDLAAGADDLPVLLASVMASNDGVSFQDTQSIGRAFGKYFDFEIPRDEAVNDIILALAARHAIVHAGGIVDARMLKQLRLVSPRSLKPRIIEGEQLQFSPSEIDQASDAMKAYFRLLASGVAGAE